MSLNTAEKVLLSIAVIDLAGLILWIGVCLHLAYSKMDLMLDHLKNLPSHQVARSASAWWALGKASARRWYLGTPDVP